MREARNILERLERRESLEILERLESQKSARNCQYNHIILLGFFDSQTQRIVRNTHVYLYFWRRERARGRLEGARGTFGTSEVQVQAFEYNIGSTSQTYLLA